MYSNIFCLYFPTRPEYKLFSSHEDPILTDIVEFIDVYKIQNDRLLSYINTYIHKYIHTYIHTYTYTKYYELIYKISTVVSK